MNIAQFFYCIALLRTKPAFTAFQGKVYMSMHSKTYVSHQAMSPQISHYIPISKIQLHDSQDSTSFVFFIGLNVLCFMFQKTTMSCALCFKRLQCLLLHVSKDCNVFCLLRFQRLQCLLFYDSKTTMYFAFTFSKTSMSSIFYIFKDFNVFSLLHFQRILCLLSFTLSKTRMSYAL